MRVLFALALALFLIGDGGTQYAVADDTCTTQADIKKIVDAEAPVNSFTPIPDNMVQDLLKVLNASPPPTDVVGDSAFVVSAPDNTLVLVYYMVKGCSIDHPFMLPATKLFEMMSQLNAGGI